MAMRCVVERPSERKIERPAIGIGLTVAGVILAALIGGGELYAGEKKEVYISPGADKKTLINEPLHGVPGHEITVAHYSFPAGWIGGKHYHTGPVYVYVLEGSFTIDEQGRERQNFKPGELYREPIGAPMQARNLNASEPLKVLVFQLGPKGEPLMIKAD